MVPPEDHCSKVIYKYAHPSLKLLHTSYLTESTSNELAYKPTADRRCTLSYCTLKARNISDIDLKLLNRESPLASMRQTRK